MLLVSLESPTGNVLNSLKSVICSSVLVNVKLKEFDNIWIKYLKGTGSIAWKEMQREIRWVLHVKTSPL